MNNFRVYEDNAGGIHVVAGNRIFPNWQGMNPQDFQREFRSGFSDVDDYEYDEEFFGVSESQMIQELREFESMGYANIVADMTNGVITLYPNDMGIEARRLFQYQEEEL